MPYVLGIDVGTEHTTAAISRLDEPDADGAEDGVEIVALSRSRALASVLYLAEDGTTLVGDAAAARIAQDPARTVRGFLRRVGDDVPLLVGGESYTAVELTGMFVRWVLDQVVGQEGEPPRHLVLTHPASWGGYRRGLLHQELRVRGIEKLTLLPEPIAVGEQRAGEETVEVGDTLAVYSLGAGLFGASIIRRVASGAFLLLAHAEGDQVLGGAHFTDLLLRHVHTALSTSSTELDPADPAVRSAAYRLRQACAQAKEQLSALPEAAIPVALPTTQQQVRVTRGAFVELIRASVNCTVDLLSRTVRAAALPPAQLRAVLLVGGSTRVPLIAELVTAALEHKDTVVVLDEAPELTVVKGAALAARRLATGTPAPMESQVGTVLAGTPAAGPIQLPPGRGEPDEFGAPPARPPVDIPSLRLPEPRTVADLVPGVRPGVLGVIVAVVVVAGIVLTFVFEGGSPAKPIGSSAPLVHRTGYQLVTSEHHEMALSPQGGGS